MNTLGKILVVLIFIMSIFFMAFSFVVFMTHENWKGKEDKARQDLSNAQSQNRQLETEIAKLQTQRAAENAFRTNAIALLEARLRTSSQSLDTMQQQLVMLQGERSQMGEQVNGSLKALDEERKKVDGLRQNVKAAQAERDKMFADVVALKNQVLELESTRQRLAAREESLLDRLGAATAVLRANDLSESDDIANVPPPREGEVTQVKDNKYVALTLGWDDGMRKGYRLDVHRGAKYQGKVEITKTYPDRSVAIVLADFQKGAIMRGDSVRTK